MIDWRLATTVANGVLAAQQSPDAAAPPHLEGDAVEAQRLVAEYTGLRAPVLPGEVVDRSQWIAGNLDGLRGILEPVAERMGSNLGPFAGPANAVGGALIGVEAGVISGLLAGRVLGQLEFPLLDPSGPARLLFVGPNLGAAARALDAEPRDVGRWVALHEGTHALQFGGVPWLRDHLAGLVRELMGALRVDPSRLLRMPSGDDVRALVDAARTGELAVFLLGPERRALMDRIQGLMALLEGYAEHTMDAVGAELLPDLPALRKGLERRRRDRPGVMRALEALIGLELKLRQYEQGKAFCDEVVAYAGIRTLNRVWEAPERLPSLAEIEDPQAWLSRIRPAAA